MEATKFRPFLLYTGSIALKGVVSPKLYQHFLSLSIAVSIMLDSNLVIVTIHVNN